MFPHVCPALPVRHAAPSFILSLVLIKHLTQASDSLSNPGLPLAEVPGYTLGTCNLTVTLTCLPSTWTGFLPADYLLPTDRSCAWALAPSEDNLYHPLPVLMVLLGPGA